MSYTTYRSKRVSPAHHSLLTAYEQKYGVPVQLNQGARTILEQWGFWNHYKRYGFPVAAFPAPGAPHIKFRRQHHALDINAGHGKGQAQHVAEFYRSRGVPVAFNVRREPWHMDTLDEGALKLAARLVGGTSRPTLKYKSKGPSVIKMKKLLYNKGFRNFSGRSSSNRYNPFFGVYTQASVKRFQRKHGLSPDGVVGPTTWKKLGAK
jgi:hypothetical protein